jgi:hypothetical protein
MSGRRARAVAVWWEKERLNGQVVDCLTIILRTTGCYWAKRQGCSMCGYIRDTDPHVTQQDLLKQIDSALAGGSDVPDVVKIFTSGSFFDAVEISKETREKIVHKLEKLGIKKLIVESRPEFVTEEVLDEFEGRKFHLEVGIGLESASDFVREIIINKGFTFRDFEEAAKLLRKRGFRVKAYLLLKPPFLSESEAIADVVHSAIKIRELVDVVSINPTNVQKGTLVERLWQRNLYRPPWLWSAVEAVRQIRNEGIEVICHPVGRGRRSPHNCGKCDDEVSKALRDFSLHQDISILDLKCSCMEKWIKAVELERFSRVPLFQ